MTPKHCPKCNTRLSASTGSVKHEIGTMRVHNATRCAAAQARNAK